MVDEETNPETSYRRGYAHGAKQVFDAVAAALPVDVAAKVERWLSEDVNVWRLANLRGVDSTRHCSRLRSASRNSMKTRRSSTSKKRWVIVNDRMQKGYRYELSAPTGRNFDPEFKPELTPAEMLALGVFCGKYMTDTRKEFPKSWFKYAKMSPNGRDCSLNYFGVNASRPLSEWRAKGWIYSDDPRGWFQWYCRYYLGRRIPEEDRRQTKRWRAFRRHINQIKKNCEPGDPFCRPRQRQALLHWAYDSRAL